MHACLPILVSALALQGTPTLELVESVPIETSLGASDLRDAHTVWVEAIDAADTSIELAHFYASEAPSDGDAPRRSRLTPVVEALERAADRGVGVRFLLSENFRETYPDTAARLGGRDGIEVRWFDLESTTGGVLHAKTMVLDATSVFVGSQNFDWRALEHIQELGALVTHPKVAAQFLRVFEQDWATAGSDPFPRRQTEPEDPSVEIDGATVTPVFSPAGAIPIGLEWDLPHLLGLIDGADDSVWVQLLSYSPTDRDGGWFGELDTALRRAAARGVDVRLTVADWGKRRGRVEWLQSLAPVPNLEVRMVTIPPAAEGHVPFARCVHAKYMVVDGRAAWLGTSNWSESYFYASRNAGLVIEGGPAPARLSRFHLDTWNSPYAYPIDPGATYEAPRIGD